MKIAQKGKIMTGKIMEKERLAFNQRISAVLFSAFSAFSAYSAVNPFPRNQPNSPVFNPSILQFSIIDFGV
jgi:hypothetical protein